MDSEKKRTSILDRWKNSGKSKLALPLISKVPEGARIPLSSGQQRLWFLQQLFPSNTFYNASTVLGFAGALRINVLKECLSHVFDQNEIFKSTYPHQDGSPVILINDNLKVKIDELDFSYLSATESQQKIKAYIAQQAATNFDLVHGPLYRISLIKESATRFFLVLTMHHIVIDLWSMGVLKEQLADNYRLLSQGQSLKFQSVGIQYTDYAYWQRNKSTNESQLEFWMEKLSGELPILDMHTDRMYPAIPSFKGRNHTQEFSAIFSERILNLAKSLEVTPFVLLLSAYNVLLAKHSSQDDIIVGSPISVRNEQSLEDLLGFFIDTVVFRSHIDVESVFSAFVNQVRRTVLEVFSNKDIPFAELVNALKIDRSLASNPLFQTMFVYDSEQKPLSFGDGVEILDDFEFDPGVSKFDLTLFVKEKNGQLSLTFEYSTDIFDEATILRFQDHLKLILEAVTDQPDCKIKEIQVLTEQEKHFFLQNNIQSDTTFDNYNVIHEIISDCALKTPNAIAVICEDKSITYQELLRRTEAIIPLIIRHSKGENKIVALATNRSLDMIVGMLAILRAGCAYLPIDSDFPTQRIDYMLEDAGVELILTQEVLKKNYSDFEGSVLIIDDTHPEIDAEFINNVKNNENDLAYVIYTSGSTGKPKGVPISHKNIMNSTAGRLSFYENNPTVFLLLSSLSFDSSKAGIFWTLCTGGTLLISAKRAEQDLEGLARTIKQYKVSHTLMLPTLYHILLDYADDDNINSLSNVIVAGETCSSFLAKKHFKVLPHTHLYNEYGPTEATVWCIAYKILPKNSETSIPIGKPVANAQVYLLDGNKSLVPYGAVGEIHIGGHGLSSGYLNRPDLVAKAYIVSPFGSTEDEKLYKTGDFGRYNQDGDIEFLGRVDDQIKIRGYRIELDEIENVILSHHQVQEVTVLIGEDEVNIKSKRLVAFVRTSDKFDEKMMKQELRANLPDYMIPSVFITVKDFPLLPNGKIDKLALLAIERPIVRKNIEGDDLPSNELEQNLVKIWQEVLELSFVGVNDNFFEIGGDSILSIQMLSKAREQKILLSPNQIFEYQTIRELSTYVIENVDVKDKWNYLVPFRTEGYKKPLFCLHAGGGHVFFYQGLVDHIDPERPLYALQASGVYGKKGMHNTIAEMAEDYIKIIKSVQDAGPYNILVYCFSATVGHEISMRMKNSGELCNLIVMDTMAKPWTLNTPNRIKIRALGFYRRLLNKPFYTLNHMVSIRLNNLMNQTYKVIGNEEQKTLEELRANLARLSRTYEWKSFKGKISLILTEKPHESLNKETINSWKEFAQDGINVLKTKGKHSFLFLPDNLQYVAKKIEQCIKD